VKEFNIREVFGKYGKMKELHLYEGYCFIEYYDYRAAQEAILYMDGKKVLSYPDRLTVEPALKVADQDPKVHFRDRKTNQ